MCALWWRRRPALPSLRHCFARRALRRGPFPDCFWHSLSRRPVLSRFSPAPFLLRVCGLFSTCPVLFRVFAFLVCSVSLASVPDGTTHRPNTSSTTRSHSSHDVVPSHMCCALSFQLVIGALHQPPWTLTGPWHFHLVSTSSASHPAMITRWCTPFLCDASWLSRQRKPAAYGSAAGTSSLLCWTALALICAGSPLFSIAPSFCQRICPQLQLFRRASFPSS